MIRETPGPCKRRVIVPANFDPREFVRPQAADKALYLMGTILRKVSRQDPDGDDYGWVRLHSDVLGRTLGTNYQRITTRLVEAGALVRNDSYSVNRYSKSYHLGEMWHGQDVRVVELTDPWLLKRLDDESRRLYQERKARVNESHWRIIHNTNNHVSLADGAEGTARDLDWHAQIGQLAAIAAIEDGVRWPNVCKWGRLHTPVCGLKKTIRRKYLRIDGEATCEVDVRSCQPALLSLLIQHQTEGHRMVLGGVSRQVGRPWPTLPLPSGLPAVDGVELERYVGVCSRGALVDFLLTLLGWPESQRSKVKLAVVKDVLARKGTYVSPVARQFKAAFPTIWRFVRFATVDDHRAVILSLQRLESWLMFGFVVPQLRGLKVSTIHDAVVCRERDAAAVESGMLDAFSAVGLRASVKLN